MENLTNQIQKEIARIPHCEFQNVQDMKDRGLSSRKDGHLYISKYVIPCGSLEGKKITIGIEILLNDYPRLPPHFIHLKKKEFSEEAIKKMDKIHEEYKHNGENWIVLSRPPQDIWDGLNNSNKNLNTFFETHLRKFWKCL